MAAFAAPRFADNGLDDSSAYSSSSSSRPRLANEDDKWEHVRDVIMRRKIQNRISQQNRRKRLKETGKDGRPRPDGRKRLSSSQSISSQDTVPALITPEGSPYNDCGRFLSQAAYIMTDTPSSHSFSGSSLSSSSFSSSSTSHLSSDLGAAHSQSASGPVSEKDTKSVVSHVLSSQGQLRGRKSKKVERYQPSPLHSQNDFKALDQDSWDLSFLSSIQGLDIDNFDPLLNGGCPFLPSLPDTEPLAKTQSKIGQYDQNLVAECCKICNTALWPTFNLPNLSKVVEVASTPLASAGLTSNILANSLTEYTLPSGWSSPPEEVAKQARSTISDSGYTAFHLAVQEGHTGIIQLLLDTGVNINATTPSGLSPLHLAVSAGKHSTAHLLLQRGASADLCNALGQMPLHFAIEKDHLALVQLLLDYCSEPNAPDCAGRTPLHLAVARGQEEIVRFLLMRGVDLQAKIGAGLR